MRSSAAVADAQLSLTLGRRALKSQADTKRAEIEQLAPLMYELAKDAERNGRIGATISDLRVAAAERRIVLTGSEKKRDLSYLGAVPRAAGLEVVPGVFRRSEIPDSHGNIQRTWRVPRGYE